MASDNSSSFSKLVVLGEWWLVKVESSGSCKRLGVGGMTSGWNQAKRIFHSSPIVKRHDAFTIETADGITISIQGLLNKARTHKNGFPPEACRRFLTGFPFNWEFYADQYIVKDLLTTAISHSLLNEFSSPLSENAHVESPICLDEVPVSMLRDCLISTHGSSVFKACDHAANSSKNSTAQKDADITNSIFSLIGPRFVKETPPPCDDHPKFGDTSEKNTADQSFANSQNAGPKVSQRTILSKELENFTHGSCGHPINEASKRHIFFEKFKSPNAVDSKYQSLPMAEKISRSCEVGQRMQEKTNNKHETAQNVALFGIAKGDDEGSWTILVNEGHSSSSLQCNCDLFYGSTDDSEEGLASDAFRIEQDGVQCVPLAKSSVISNLATGTDAGRKAKSGIDGENTDSFFIARNDAVDRASHATGKPNTEKPSHLEDGKLSGADSSNAAGVYLKEISLKSHSVESKGRENDIEETGSPAQSLMKCKRNLKSLLTPLSRRATLMKTPRMHQERRRSARLKNLMINQKTNSTSEPAVDNEKVLKTTTVPCVIPNDGAGCKLNADFTSNASYLSSSDAGIDLCLNERPDGCHESNQVPSSEVLSQGHSMGDMGCYNDVLGGMLQTSVNDKDGGVSSKDELSNSKETIGNFEGQTMSWMSRNAEDNLQVGQFAQREVGIEQNQVLGNFASDVGTEQKERSLLAEIDVRDLKSCQEHRNEVDSTVAESVALRGMLQDGKNKTPLVKAQTSEEFVCKPDARRSSSRLRSSRNKQGLEQTMRTNLPIEKTGNVVANRTVDNECNLSAESTPRLAKVITESLEEIDTQQKERSVLTETNEKLLDSGHERRNEVERNLIPEKNGKNKIHREKVNTSEEFACKSDARKSSSRLGSSRNKLGLDQTSRTNLQIENTGDVAANRTVDDECNLSAESTHEAKVMKKSFEEIGRGFELTCGDGADCLWFEHGIDMNEQKGRKSSVSKLKRNEERKGSTQMKNVTQSGHNSYENYWKKTKKLSFASPESLNFKRSRSGRLLVPPVANWKNEKVVYNRSGGISGITFSSYESISPSGGKPSGGPNVQKMKKGR